MEHLTIDYQDERTETKGLFPADKLKIAEVIEAAGVTPTEEQPLTLTVVLRDQPTSDDPNLKKKYKGVKALPTSFAHPKAPTKIELKTFTDAKTGEEVKVHQEVPDEEGEPDVTCWHLHLQVLAKDELSYGTMRAISRAVSREVYLMSAIRAYGIQGMEAMFDKKDFEVKSKEFADDAPWCLS